MTLDMGDSVEFKLDGDSKIKILDYPTMVYENVDPEKFQELWDRMQHVTDGCVLCDKYPETLRTSNVRINLNEV